MTLAERIAARLSGISTDRYMFGLFGEGRMGEGGFGKLQILGKTKHVTRCQNCGRAGLKHAVVCAVVGEDGHPTNQYYYFGTDCAAKLAGKAEKDVEAEAEHQESSGRPRMKNLKPAKPNEGQMELSLRFAAAWQAHVERYGRVKPTRGQAAFDFDALASAPQAEAPAPKAAAVEPPALPSKGRQMGLFDQPQAAAPAAKPASDWDKMSLADKLAWQKKTGLKRPEGTAAPASPEKPKATPKVKMSGAVYDFVAHNSDGTIRVRNDQGDEFDSALGEAWGQHGEHPIPKPAGDWDEQKHPRWDAGDKQHHGGQFAPKEAEKPATEAPKPTDKARLTPPEFRDWRFVSSTRNSGTIYPNRPGQSFTPEQIAHLQKWARQNGMTTHQSGPYKIEVVGNDHKERLDLDFMGAFGVKREKQNEAASQAKAKEAERKQQAVDSFSGRPSADFINSAFGDSMNTANKTYLADFLEGKERKFNGIWGRNHVEGLQKLNAINAQGQVDFKALQSAYQSHGSEQAKFNEARAKEEQPAEPKGKEPWQMTRSEYSGAVPFPSGGPGVKQSGALKPGSLEESHVRLLSRLPLELGEAGFEGTTALRSLESNGLVSRQETRNGPFISVHWVLTDKGQSALDSQSFTPDESHEKWVSHKELVSKAVAAGKPVPSEVLADYPELQKSPAVEAEGSGSPTATATVGEKVAAAITKKSMDFGRKVEVRKDRAKKLGPRAKIEEPAEQVEGWARRYKIARIDKSRDKSEEGKYAIYDTRTKSRYTGMGHRQATSKVFDSEAEAKAALPLLEVARNHGVYQSQDGKSYEIRRKFDRHSALVKGGFNSRDEAARHMAMNPREIINHKFPSYETYQYLTEVERKGPERRKGDVNERDFQEAFNPGGAVFGNWMSNKDGVAAFHHAHDSLHDLADVLEIHPQQVSLDGDLVYGFGAAGSGGKNAARAHYEPRQRLINLTKMAGAGSLAHEWWHALDHFIAKHHQLDSHTAVGSKASYMKGDEGLKKAIKDLHHALHNTAEDRVIEAHDKAQDEKEAKRLQYRAEKREEAIKARQRIPYADSPADHLHNIRVGRDSLIGWKKKKFDPALLEQYDELEKKIAAGDHGEEVYVPSKSKWGLGTTTYANIKALDEVHKKITGRSFLAADGGNEIYHQFKVDKAKAQEKAERAAKAGQTERVFRPSTFSREAVELDRSRASAYYTLPEEMGARAFEAYIEDKLNEKGIRSDYLIGKGKTSNAVYRAFGLPGPFPEGEERKQINEAFDKLMVEVRKHLRKPEKENHSLADEARELNERVSRLVERYSAGQLPDYVSKVYDTTDPKHDNQELGAAGWISNGHLNAFHVTDNPDKVLGALKSGSLTSHNQGQHEDLGPGLYASGVPHYWRGRAANRWNFLESLNTDQLHKLADHAIGKLRQNVSEGYNSQSEAEPRINELEMIKSGKYPKDGLSWVAGQPYNIDLAHPQLLKSLGIQPGQEPHEIPIKAQGKFAELKRSIGPEQQKELAGHGFHGAFISGGMHGNPQVVIWDHSAVKKFGDYEHRPEPKPATNLFGEAVKPAPKAPAKFESSKGKQQALFAGLNAKEGQMNLFADNGVPDDLVAKPQEPQQKSLFSAVASALGASVERYAAEQAHSPWFLKSRELLKQKMGQHAPASQVLALLKNNQISPEELEWTGLEKHLRSKGNSPVSQQELHDLIGRFGVEESVLGDKGYSPKYGQYSLPGGENYREMLLKLPERHVYPETPVLRAEEQERFINLNLKMRREGNLPSSEMAEWRSLKDRKDKYQEELESLKAKGENQKPYRSGHWDDPNVLAHIRYKDYVGPDGKKHLHIDEIQSDWHQQGRKQGYSSPELDQKNLARIQELGAKFDRKEATPEEVSELEQLHRSRSNRDIQSGVPDAPFKKNWHMLAMKRMLHHAAANGYDRVTWTPGEEHASRYDLSAHVRGIYYHPESKHLIVTAHDGNDVINGRLHDGIIHDETPNGAFHKKHVDDVLGKETTAKLFAQPVREDFRFQQKKNWQGLRGDGLKLGGEGMKGFYDQMLPADTNKLIKRHGGKVGQFDLHLPEHSDGGGYEAKPPRAIKVHGFDITPSMKAEATSGKGQSMFSVYEEPDLQIERYEQPSAPPQGPQPRFRIGAGEQRAAEQFTKIPSTKPPAIFSFLGKAAGLVGKAAGMAKGAFAQAGDKALGAIQPAADKLAGKIGGAAESLDRKGQAAMSKVGMAPKPAQQPAKAPKAQSEAEKPATQGVKAGAPVRLAQAHDIHGNGRQFIPEGTQGTYIGPHSQKGHAEVEINGIRHVIPTKSLGYAVEHTDHKAIEQHKQTQAEQAQKQKQLTARQRAEAVPEGMEKAERKSLHIGAHDLQPGDVIHHGEQGAHPYGRVLEVHPDGKHVVVEEATPSKGSPDGIATTGRRLTIPGHEKMEGGGSATRMFHTKRLPDEARPIGERKEYKEFFKGAKQLGVHDDVAHEMAMQLWDDSQAMRTPKGFKDGAKVQTEEQMKAPFKANWQQAQEAKDAKSAPAAQQSAPASAQSAPAQPAAQAAAQPKPRHHVSNLQAGDMIRPLKGSESKVNLRYLGPGSSKGFIAVEHPQFGKQEVSVKSVGLLMPKQGGRNVPAMSGRDQMAERAAIMQFDGGLNRKQAARAAVIERGRQNAPEMHQVKRSDFAMQRQGVLAKDKQGNGFLLYGGKRYPLSPAEFDGNKLASDPVKIRERIHREQIKALATKDPAAVPAHVKAEYEHHFDRWAGNSPFAKGGGKQPQRQSAKNQPNAGQMSLSPGMAVQPQAPQTPPVLQPPIEARRQAQRVVNADRSQVKTEIDPNRPQAQIDRREAANRAFMDAIAAKFNQGQKAPPVPGGQVHPRVAQQGEQIKAPAPNQPAGGLAASPPPTQPVVAASAPPAVSNPAQEQKTPLWQLTRPHKMGRNEVNVQFDSAKQRDLHDYAASVANARSFSGKAGRGKPNGAEQQRAKLKAVADAHFGGDMDAAHQEALQVRAHVKAHMAGAQDGEHRVIPPLGVQSAKPQAPEQPAGDDTMPWDQPASPERAQAHTDGVLRGHLKEFARMEAAKTERLRQLWKQYRESMGVPADRRFSGARQFKDAVASGADREGTMQKNWDVVAPELAREAPTYFGGDDRDDKIWEFLSGDPPQALKWDDDELAEKFWKRVHPTYAESLERMNRGESPLERLKLADFLSDSHDDWQESSRWQDDTGPYRASAATSNAFTERFSAAWSSHGGGREKEGVRRSRKLARRGG